MNKTKSIYLALLAVLLSPMAANADVIVDTGNNGGGIRYVLSGSQWIAGQFSIVDDYSITSIQGWIGVSNLGDLTVAIYSDIAGLPGTELYSSAFTSSGANSWQGLTGLAWDIVSGTYFAAFEVRPGQSFFGELPGGAINPLPGYAFTTDGNWVEFDGINSSFRINADAASVPEPGTLALLGLGLAGMGMTRRKKKV